ncbi:MAG: hypothetical protein ABSG37_08185 [Candidatus Limnocylindrales bacterium]|jgi:hypothetical protein
MEEIDDVTTLPTLERVARDGDVGIAWRLLERCHHGTRDGGTRDGGTRDGGTRDGGTRDGGTRDPGGTANRSRP